MTDTTPPAAQHPLYRRILVLFLPLALLVLGGTWFLVAAEQRRQETRLLADEALQVRLGQGVLSYRLRQVTGDVLILARMRSLVDTLEHPDAANRARLAEDFVAFADAKQAYLQVRWLDETGKERVRVDYAKGRARVIPEADLQDKSKRYYFREAATLNRSQLFVSPLDLNVEHDQVEVPYKPTLRVATPVFNGQGGRRGIVLLNYSGAHLLDRYRAVTQAAADHIMLLDRDGYWLAAPNPADEWGFMFARKDSFASRHPQAWRRIQAGEAGQFRAADGLWSFTTVHPLEDAEGGAGGTQPHVWKVVSHLPPSRLAVRADFLGQTLLASGLILVLLGLGAFRLARAWRWEHEAAESLRRLNAQLQGEVAERAQAEQVARGKEAYFAALINTAPDAILVIDARGRVELCNPEVERLFGYPAGELVGHNVSRIMASPEREAHDGYLARYLAHGEPHVIGSGRDVQARRKDGSLVAIHLRVGEQRLDDGSRRYIGFMRDVSERLRAEAELERHRQHLEELVAARTGALQEAEQRIRLMLESSADGIYGCDVAGRFTFANPAACRMLGYAVDELVGREVHALIHHSHPDGHTYPVETCTVHADLRAGRPVRVVHDVYWRGDGQPLHVALASQPMWRDGAIIGAVVNFSDIHERIEAEAALRRQAEALRVQNESLEKFNQIMIGRELDMIRLKGQVNELARRLGEAEPHDLRFVEGAASGEEP